MNHVEITRYPNRRLYDRSQKKYVTVGEIEEMVLTGKNILVRDSKSNDDLTRTVLMQILIERHPERLALFPVAVLQEMIRADQMVLDWLRLYLSQARTLINGVGGPPDRSYLPGMDLWQSLMSGRAATEMRDTANETEPEANGEPATVESPQDLSQRIAALEQRIRQLESEQRSAADAADSAT